MAKSYKIIGSKSWANTSMRWTYPRQDFLLRPWWATITQPYPAGTTIIGDEQIAISGLPVSIYDKLQIKRFGFGDVTIGVESGNLPVEAVILGTLDLENDVSGYEIVESAQYVGGTTSASAEAVVPDLFTKVNDPINDDPDKFYVEDIASVKLPLFLIRAPSDASDKNIYGSLANFSKSQKFTVIKLAWGPLSIVQGQKGPILLGGISNPNPLNTGQEVYE